jgi:hypothetical protein
MLQRVQEFYAHLEADNKTAMDDILAKCGLAELMDIRLSQGIRQEENLEVWCA